MKRVRVVVVDDSAVARRLLVKLLGRDPELEIVGEVASGREAVAVVETLRPDVVTMDIHMPGMDGYETTSTIMERAPTPIVIVSADYDSGDVARSFKALQAGAVTVLPKPNGLSAIEFEAESAELVETVKLMAGVKVFRRHRRSRTGLQIPRSGPRGVQEMPLARGPVTGPGREIGVVAIGASTGGPAALAAILGPLPADLPVPVLVVQHLARGFDEGLARWLDGVTSLDVHLAEEGEPLEAGTALVAPHGVHMAVAGRRVSLTEGAPVRGHRPSATILFSTVAGEFGGGAVGIILTGMGDDGVAGLRELKAAGGIVIGQDEASCVVYGMPKAAARAGLVDRVLPVTEIGWTLRDMLVHPTTLAGAAGD